MELVTDATYGTYGTYETRLTNDGPLIAKRLFSSEPPRRDPRMIAVAAIASAVTN